GAPWVRVGDGVRDGRRLARLVVAGVVGGVYALSLDDAAPIWPVAEAAAGATGGVGRGQVEDRVAGALDVELDLLEARGGRGVASMETAVEAASDEEGR